VNQRIEKTKMRVCAVSSVPSGTLVYAIDRNKKLRVLETALDVKSVKPGDVVEVAPDQDKGERLVCKSADSVTATEDSSFPSLESLSTKLRDARDESSLTMVEVIALSHGMVEDVSMIDGSLVKKGELVVGDDTSEMKVVAWRELSGMVNSIQPGQRLRIAAVLPKATKMGGWVLQASNITVVDKIMGS